MAPPKSTKLITRVSTQMVPPKPTKLFTRVFTEKDELVLLEYIIKFESNEGYDPVDNITAFTEFVKHALSFNAEPRQLSDKIRRLKSRYMNARKRGPEPYFSGDHNRKVFKLSNEIWAGSVAGDDDDGDSDENERLDSSLNSHDDYDVGGNEKERKAGADEKDGFEDCRKLYPLLCFSIESEAKKASPWLGCSKEYLEMVATGIDHDKARELEKEWRGFLLMEQKAYVKRTEVIRQQAEAVIDVISSTSGK